MNNKYNEELEKINSNFSGVYIFNNSVNLEEIDKCILCNIVLICKLNAIEFDKNNEELGNIYANRDKCRFEHLK